MLSGAALSAAHAQITTSGANGPRQLTMPPHEDVEDSAAIKVDDSSDTGTGASSVLPNRRNCASDVMIIGRPLAGAETPKLKDVVASHVSATPGCRITAADTNPAPILSAPPNGVTPPVSPYAIRESTLASR